jgi:hypothetical protein
MEAGQEREISILRQAAIGILREKYRELFGEEPRNKHREQLFRRIAWRMQAVGSLGISEAARQRALAIADLADLRMLPPRRLPSDLDTNDAGTTDVRRGKSRFDRRIPAVGTVLERVYGGTAITVTILDDGFEHQGRRYGSLSAIATEVTGTRWNGLAFWGISGTRRMTKGNLMLSRRWLFHARCAAPSMRANRVKKDSTRRLPLVDLTSAIQDLVKYVRYDRGTVNVAILLRQKRGACHG